MAHAGRSENLPGLGNTPSARWCVERRQERLPRTSSSCRPAAVLVMMTAAPRISAEVHGQDVASEDILYGTNCLSYATVRYQAEGRVGDGNFFSQRASEKRCNFSCSASPVLARNTLEAPQDYTRRDHRPDFPASSLPEFPPDAAAAARALLAFLAFSRRIASGPTRASRTAVDYTTAQQRYTGSLCPIPPCPPARRRCPARLRPRAATFPRLAPPRQPAQAGSDPQECKPGQSA